MSTTPAEFFETANSMKAAGASTGEIIQALLDKGAALPDIMRAVILTEHVNVGQARDLINETGLLPRIPERLTVVVPDDDPWYAELFGSGPPGEGAS